MNALIALLFLGLSVIGQADSSHYPYDHFAHAGEHGGVFRGTYRSILPLALNVNYDPSFTPDQALLIQQAAAIFVNRALQPQVVACAFRNSSKDTKGGSADFTAELYRTLQFWVLNDLVYPGYAYVARFWGDSSAVGIGYVGLFYQPDLPLPGYGDRHYFHIALNSDFMGPTSDYRYANDAEYWAGVLGHEILHNLGYTHPRGYPGSFIKEYGNCVWRNGVDQELPQDLPEDVELFPGM